MVKNRNFFLAYLSIFGLLLFFQLDWAKQSEIYHDIFLRFFFSFLVTSPVMYIFLQIIHLIKSRLQLGTDIESSVSLLLPFSVFHLQWFQYVNDYKWPYSSLAIYITFGITFLLTTTLTLRSSSRTPNHTIKTYLHLHDTIHTVNVFFVDGLKGCCRKLLYSLSNPVRFAGLIFYPVTWVLISMQIILLVKYCAFGFQQAYLLPLYVAATILMPVLLVQAAMSFTSRTPFFSTLISYIIAAIYFLLTLYHITEDSPLDFSLLRLNSDLLLHKQSYILLSEKLRLQSYMFTCFCIAIAILLFVKRRPKERFSPLNSRLFPGALACSAFYIFLLFLPLQNMDQIRTLYQSVNDYRIQEKSLSTASALLKEPFPYKKIQSQTTSIPGPLPNIFLICLESCNGLLIEQKTEKGHQITPFFNSLIPQGVYIEHFYGNSVQTARGFFTLLTGIAPSFRKKVATSFTELSFCGLPAILANQGYSTFFIKAFHDLSYDNTGEFMKKAGYKNVLSMTEDILTEEEKKMKWGWGLQDNFFYKKCFSILDEDYKKRTADNLKQPYFITTFNVSNHMMFQDIPEDQKYLYPEAGPNDYHKNYRNSMFVADSCLRELLTQIKKRKWLDNSIIIITGDHSFPSGQHSKKNEKGAWEENFRTPFLILWDGHLEPQRLSSHAYSQIDLMPTIFDLLKINPAHHSTGKSIFESGPRDPVMLSQPYDGIYLAGIEYPFKYVKRLKGNSQFLYNLNEDPLEQHNLILKRSLQPTVARLQKSITYLMINQALIEQNRIWPH